jgi:hypothetical protein
MHYFCHTPNAPHSINLLSWPMVHFLKKYCVKRLTWGAWGWVSVHGSNNAQAGLTRALFSVTFKYPSPSNFYAFLMHYTLRGPTFHKPSPSANGPFFKEILRKRLTWSARGWGCVHGSYGSNNAQGWPELFSLSLLCASQVMANKSEMAFFWPIASCINSTEYR